MTLEMLIATAWWLALVVFVTLTVLHELGRDRSRDRVPTGEPYEGDEQ